MGDPNVNKRGNRRFPGPFSATWSGQAIACVGRLTDISEGGCFVESLAIPVADEVIHLSPSLIPDEPALLLAGHVAYVSPPIGFGVMFTLDAATLEDLRRVLSRL